MTTKIEKRITGYAVKKESLPELVALAEIDKSAMGESVKRPEQLEGTTYKIKTPASDHAMYVTINDITLEDGEVHPYEMFINTKDVEHFQWVLALTRVISAVFRKGGEVDFLAEELKSVFDPKGGYFKKGVGYVPSLVADIGLSIEEHLERKNG